MNGINLSVKFTDVKLNVTVCNQRDEMQGKCDQRQEGGMDDKIERSAIFEN